MIHNSISHVSGLSCLPGRGVYDPACVETIGRQVRIPLHLLLQVPAALNAGASALAGVCPGVPGTGPDFREEEVGAGHKRSRVGLVGAMGHRDSSHDQAADGDQARHFQFADHAQVIGSAGKNYHITAKVCQRAQKAVYYTPGGVSADSLINEHELMARLFPEQSLPQPELI